jgi:ABC-type multidrug transport system fused ATPase/permease subunit
MVLRAFATGGYADISRLQAWNLDFVVRGMMMMMMMTMTMMILHQQEKSEEGSRYRKLASKVDESLRFMRAIGVDTDSATFKQAQFYTAHECLLLPYEQALTRKDSTTGEGTMMVRMIMMMVVVVVVLMMMMMIMLTTTTMMMMMMMTMMTMMMMMMMMMMMFCRPLVRLLGAHAVDRGEDPAARRLPCRVHAG